MEDVAAMSVSYRGVEDRCESGSEGILMGDGRSCMPYIGDEARGVVGCLPNEKKKNNQNIKTSSNERTSQAPILSTLPSG